MVTATWRSGASRRRTASNCPRSKKPCRGGASANLRIMGMRTSLPFSYASRSIRPRMASSRLIVPLAAHSPRRFSVYLAISAGPIATTRQPVKNCLR